MLLHVFADLYPYKLQTLERNSRGYLDKQCRWVEMIYIVNTSCLIWLLVRYISKLIFKYSFWLSIVVHWKSFGFLDRLIKWFRHSNTWGPPSLRPPFSLKAAVICLVRIINMHYQNMFAWKWHVEGILDVCSEKQFLLWDIILHISHWNMIL